MTVDRMAHFLVNSLNKLSSISLDSCCNPICWQGPTVLSVPPAKSSSVFFCINVSFSVLKEYHLTPGIICEYECVHMCTCVYICMCVCMYVCVLVCMCANVCMFVCVHVWVHMCMCAQAYVCAHTCVYACTVYICVCRPMNNLGSIPYFFEAASY